MIRGFIVDVTVVLTVVFTGVVIVVTVSANILWGFNVWISGGKVVNITISSGGNWVVGGLMDGFTGIGPTGG